MKLIFDACSYNLCTSALTLISTLIEYASDYLRWSEVPMTITVVDDAHIMSYITGFSSLDLICTVINFAQLSPLTTK